MTRTVPSTDPGLDPSWSRHLAVPGHDGRTHDWHLLDHGTATVGTLLCVHGNPTWSYLWRRLLADPPPGWRVVAPDHLGMGWSERTATPRTYADRVRDLGDLTAALGLDGPVVTVGHDWGGAISLGWALDHREQLRGVVLANTAVAQPPGDRGPLLIRLAHLRALRSLTCVRTPMFVGSTSRISWPPLPREVRSALADPYRSAARRQGVGDFVADVPFAGDHPSGPAVAAVADGVRALDVPVLMFWGPRDPVFGERYLTDLRERLPQAEVHRFEGAGHLVTEDAPAYADLVRTWVADLGDASPDQPPSTTTPATTTPAKTTPITTTPAAGRRLWTALAERARDEALAVVDLRGDSLTWAELSARVDAVAAGLVAAGLGPGDRIGLLVEPSVELTVTVYAVWRAGGVVVVADKGLGFAGMRRALRGASLDWVVGAPAGLAAARAMGLPGGRFAAGGPRAVWSRLGADHDLASLEALGRDSSPPPEPSLDAECAVLFTSGATGPAKGVVYRHRQAAAQLDLVRATYDLDPSDRLVAAFAPFALLGPGLGIGSVVPDVDVTAPGSLTAAGLAEAVGSLRATAVFASVAALRRVVETAGSLDEAQRAALGGVRLLVSAGAPVPLHLLERVQTVLPAAALHTPYGMTEVLPVTDVSFEQIREAGPGEGVCVGRPVDGVAVRIAALDADGRAAAAPAETPAVTGEICVRAPHVKERYDALWATERDTSRDPGWHRTGDVGHLDDAGRLWVEGRLVHVVTAAEGVVTPVPVEQRVEALPEVGSAAAVGVGPVGTQAVVVVVVPLVGAPRRLAPASLALSEAVRSVAGVPLAAVLAAPSLPVDVRHQSKVDRHGVARRAEQLLR